MSNNKRGNGYDIKGPMITPLNTWTKLAGSERVAHLAKEVGISTQYVHALANVYRENPHLRLAIDIVTTIKSINEMAKEVDGVELPEISLYDLAIPTRQTSYKGRGRWAAK